MEEIPPSAPEKEPQQTKEVALSRPPSHPPPKPVETPPQQRMEGRKEVDPLSAPITPQQLPQPLQSQHPLQQPPQQPQPQQSQFPQSWKEDRFESVVVSPRSTTDSGLQKLEKQAKILVSDLIRKTRPSRRAPTAGVDDAPPLSDPFNFQKVAGFDSDSGVLPEVQLWRAVNMPLGGGEPFTPPSRIAGITSESRGRSGSSIVMRSGITRDVIGGADDRNSGNNGNNGNINSPKGDSARGNRPSGRARSLELSWEGNEQAGNQSSQPPGGGGGGGGMGWVGGVGVLGGLVGRQKGDSQPQPGNKRKISPRFSLKFGSSEKDVVLSEPYDFKKVGGVDAGMKDLLHKFARVLDGSERKGSPGGSGDGGNGSSYNGEMTLDEFLRKYKLEHIGETLRAQDVLTVQNLRLLSPIDLAEIGIKMGPRAALRAAFEDLDRNAQAQQPPQQQQQPQPAQQPPPQAQPFSSVAPRSPSGPASPDISGPKLSRRHSSSGHSRTRPSDRRRPDSNRRERREKEGEGEKKEGRGPRINSNSSGSGSGREGRRGGGHSSSSSYALFSDYGGLWIDYDELIIEKEIAKGASSIVYLGRI